MKIIIGVLAGYLSAFALNAYALESVSGMVHEVTVNSPTASNRNVIVVLKDPTTNSDMRMCNLATNFSSAYINKADSPDTFPAFLSALLMAKSTKSSVQVLTSIGAEECKIERVSLR